MEQEQTNQNQAEANNKSGSGQALLALGSRKSHQFFFEDESNVVLKEPVSLRKFFNTISRQVYTIACGTLHTLVLTTNGEVYSFGCNDDGALGRTGNENEPLKVDLEVPVDMISAGDAHSVACNSARSLVYHWGVYRSTAKGKISNSETPLRIGEDEFKKKKLKQVISGANHTLALVDGKIYAWGDSEVGILGRLQTSRRKADHGMKIEGMGVKGVVEEIYTGAYHAFLKKTEKKKNETYTAIYAWGLNSCGQLGIGNTENQYNPVEVTGLRDKNIKNITGGENHTIVLTEEGDVYSFGKNDAGQLGLGQDFEEKEESEPEEEVEEKKTPAKPAKPPAKSTSKKGKGKGKKGGNQKKGQDAEEDKAEEEKEETAEKKDEEQSQEKEGEKPKEDEKEKTAADSQEPEAEKKEEEKNGEGVKEAAAEPEKDKAPKNKSNKKKEKEAEPAAAEEEKSADKSVKKPQKVEIANVEKIFSGSHFNYAVTKEQDVYSWGTGDHFVLGNKNNDAVYKPTKLEGNVFEGKRIVVLGLGAQHVIALGVDKDGKDPELDEEAFAQAGEQSKSTKKGTTAKKGEKKGKGKKGEEEEAEEKDVKKNLTASLSLEEETEEKDEKNKRGQKKSLKRKASDENDNEENGIKKVKKSPTKEIEAAAESKMEEEKPSTESTEAKKAEEEAPAKADEAEQAATAKEDAPAAANEDTGKMEEEKPAENKAEEEAKPEEKAAEPEEKATEPVQQEEEKKVEPVEVEAEGEKKEENKEVVEAANESENKAQEGTA